MARKGFLGAKAFASARLRVLGIGFLVLVVAFVWLTYAIFAKKFVDYDRVALNTSTIGLQLPSRADVKIRGVIVGDVLDKQTSGDGARLTLGLDPDQVDIIPANVSARILPKTLFGEKYVSLQIPKQPSAQHIEAGDVIDESQVSIEVQRVLSDLYPLLRTVQPRQINYTLTALANALEGRGERLGDNFSRLDAYLKRMNPQIPQLVDDLNKLGKVSDVYRGVVPELARTLRNSVVTGRTFVTKEQKIQALFDDVASFSDTSRDFLQANGDNIIRLARQGRETLPVLDKYAPEFPCLLDGLTGLIPRESQAFRNYTLHINLETLPNQPRGYGPQDSPVYGAKNGPISQPLCDKVLSGVYSQDNPPPPSVLPDFDDGVDEPTGKGGNNRPAPRVDMSSGLTGTAGERRLIDAVAGPVLGVDASEVPDVGTLLLGPMARGTEVSYR